MAIKDYLAVDLDNTGAAEKVRVKREPVFSVIESNETDIIIRKETPKTCRELVLIMSKQLYYVRNVKTNDNIKITSSKDISLFLSGCNLLIDGPLWFNKYYLISYSDMFEFIKRYGLNEDFVKIYSSLCHNKRYIESMFDGKEVLYGICNLLNKVSLFNCGLKGLILTLKFIEDDRLIYSRKIIGVLDLFEEIRFMDYNSLKDFLCKFKDAYGELYSDENNYRCDYVSSSYSSTHMKELVRGFNLDLSTFISYITYELSSQGYSSIPNFGEYRDTLSLQMSVYGKIKDKYPKNLLTLHNILVKKNSLLKKYKKSLAMTESYEENKHLKYSDSAYSVILPTEANELVDEGISLSHCVAVYIDRVINKECYICFIRSTKNIEESLLTVEVKEDTIVQVKGKCNRRPIDSEIKFIKKWVKEKELTMNF